MLSGYRVLVVEDYAFIALQFVETLKAAGAEIVGPAASVHDAEELLKENNISAALLDIRLDDGEVWPVARELAQKGVPFTFCTGYFSPKTLPREWGARPILTKPVQSDQLLSAVTDMLAIEKMSSHDPISR